MNESLACALLVSISSREFEFTLTTGWADESSLADWADGGIQCLDCSSTAGSDDDPAKTGPCRDSSCSAGSADNPVDAVSVSRLRIRFSPASIKIVLASASILSSFSAAEPSAAKSLFLWESVISFRLRFCFRCFRTFRSRSAAIRVARCMAALSAFSWTCPCEICRSSSLRLTLRPLRLLFWVEEVAACFRPIITMCL